MSYITVNNKLVLVDGKPIIPPNEPETQEKTIDVAANGTTVVIPDSGKLLSKVTVNTSVPSKPEQTKSIMITSNGTTTVMPDDGKTLSSVSITTNVPTIGISGRKIGTYTVNDGILSFSVAQEDYEVDDHYRNLYVKKSSALYGMFATRAVTSVTTVWKAMTETSTALEFSNECISAEKSEVLYNIDWTLGDSTSLYYSGEVTVYALPSS